MKEDMAILEIITLPKKKKHIYAQLSPRAHLRRSSTKNVECSFYTTRKGSGTLRLTILLNQIDGGRLDLLPKLNSEYTLLLKAGLASDPLYTVEQKLLKDENFETRLSQLNERTSEVQIAEAKIIEEEKERVKVFAKAQKKLLIEEKGRDAEEVARLKKEQKKKQTDDIRRRNHEERMRHESRLWTTITKSSSLSKEELSN